MDITSLEKQRETLLRELHQLGDMRSGSLSERYQRCSWSPCVCDDPKHPGHGPIYSYSTFVGGKTKIRNYKPGPALDRLRKELAAYQRFRELTRELIAVSNRLCAARAEKEESSRTQQEVKKKLPRQLGKNSRKK